MKSKAVGFLDTRISGSRQANDEQALRDTAKRKHLDLARTFACTQLVDNPPKRLTIMLGRLDADTIIVPTLEHLGNSAEILNQTYRIIEVPRIPGDDPKIWEPQTLMAGAR
ncbi:hypothetical protein [Nocardia nova]|uniref:hypothetical protein n=1 Tax=Nocardia nova TaxID=37330 RepID=UPI0027385DAD|nr:hypothetical protein [Nocardia nova]